MTDDLPFLRTVAAHPLDDGPRLVYADWLEEHGDPRAEFIRLQCQPAGFADLDRAADLLREHWRAWLAPVCDALDEPTPLDLAQWGYLLNPPLGVYHHVRVWEGDPVRLQAAEFGRGFADRLTVAGWGPLTADHFRRLADVSPLVRLHVNFREAADWPRLDGPAFADLSELVLRLDHRGPPPTDFVRAVGRSPHLAGLRRLEFQFDDAGGAVRALAASSLAANLEHLATRMNDDVLLAVLNATTFSRLRALNLSGNVRSAANLAAVIEMGALLALEEFAVEFTGPRVPPDLYRLFTSPGARRLQRLRLRGDFAAGVLRTIAESADLAGLRELAIDRVSLSGPDWTANARAGAALLASDKLPALHTLRLCCSAGVEQLQRNLADATGLPALATLDLSGTPLGDAGAAALARSPLAPRLRQLVLTQCGLTDAGRATLAEQFGDRVRL